MAKLVARKFSLSTQPSGYFKVEKVLSELEIQVTLDYVLHRERVKNAKAGSDFDMAKQALAKKPTGRATRIRAPRWSLSRD